MANTLPDGSRPMDIGEYENTHDYTMWQPKSRVMLCNVPWDSTYRDIVRFENESAGMILKPRVTNILNHWKTKAKP